jgi:hypothetical protein
MAIMRLLAPWSNASGTFSAPSLPASTSAIVAMPDPNGRTLARQFVVPANPNTTAQQAIRSYFTSISEAYQTLSQAEVEAWQAAAAEINRTGRLGLSYKMTWTQLFQSVNSYRLQAGEVITLTVPSTAGATVPATVASVTSDDGDPEQQVVITITEPATPTAGSFLAIRVTRNLSSPNRQARATDFRYPAPSEDMIFPRDTTSPYVYTFTATTLNVLSASYIGIDIRVLNAGYFPVGSLIKTNILVGTP